MVAWATRPYKALMRDYMSDLAGPRTSALFLPGWDEASDVGCLCIEHALQRGTIDLRTRIIAVERRADLISRITERLNGFGFQNRPIVHADEIHKLRFAPSTQLDYVNLDLLGALDERLAQWIETELTSHLANDACVAITMNQTWRNNRFLSKIDYAWRNDKTFRALALRFAGDFGITDRPLLINMVVVKSCFVGFNYDHVRPQLYRDKMRNMIALRLDHIQRCDGLDWPSNADVLQTLTPKVEAPMTDRSAAAHKAWATRRKLAAAKLARQLKLSAAAHKAWATRRKQSEETSHG